MNDSRSSDDVRNALAAIDAYKSIVDAINAAEKAAKEAKEAADKASEVQNYGTTPVQNLMVARSTSMATATQYY